jgi:hypothetical protein
MLHAGQGTCEASQRCDETPNNTVPTKGRRSSASLTIS